MKFAFFISSAEDTDLALATIKALEEKGHEALVISLTETAQTRVENAKLPHITLPKLLGVTAGELNPNISAAHLEKITSFLKQANVQHAFMGVPSDNNSLPFQIANA